MDTMDTTIKNKNKKRKRIGIVIIVILAIALVVSLVYVTVNKKNMTNKDSGSDYHVVQYNGKTYYYNTSIVSILLLGIDKTKKDKNRATSQGQSDAIEMLLLDRKSKKIKLLSIPRDTMTKVESFDGSGESLGWDVNHLNLAYAFGDDEESGCMHAMQAVSKMLYNVPINYYGAMDMDNITTLQNIVGNIRVKVPNNSLAKPEGWKKGDVITINASNAEKYVRTRDTDVKFSAETRLERQESYFKAFYKKLKVLLKKDFDGTVSKMYSLAKKVTTNIGYDDIVTFGNMVLDYDFSDNNYYTIPGKYKTSDLYDEYHLDKAALHKQVISIFYQSAKEAREDD